MHLDLNSIWFVLVGVLFTGYAMLDGFDLGIGALHLFTRTDQERRVMLNAIGPVWDGNEVWLVTGGGALSVLLNADRDGQNGGAISMTNGSFMRVSDCAGTFVTSL